MQWLNLKDFIMVSRHTVASLPLCRVNHKKSLSALSFWTLIRDKCRCGRARYISLPPPPHRCRRKRLFLMRLVFNAVVAFLCFGK
jgi:hypothetical protein